MNRLLPRSLSGRLICLMLLALALSQGVSLLVYRFERAHAVRTMMREECLGRAASAVHLMEATPVEGRTEQLALVETPIARYWLTPSPPTTIAAWEPAARAALLRSLPAINGTTVPSLFVDPTELDCPNPGEWEELPSSAWLLHRPLRWASLPKWNGNGVAAQLSNGTWLNVVLAKPAALSSPTPAPGYYVTLVSTVVIFSLVAWLIAWHIAQPLRRLTKAAEHFGRGEEIALTIDEGPEDIRRMMSAFSLMQVRLKKYIEDRTRMLAAISHDLRTPITSLRLRAEFVQDAEIRDKLLATLGEMQAMTEATLAFASSEASTEPTRIVDVTSLLDSLCADLAELGWDVTFSDNGDRIPIAGRSESLRRALRNVIENAVRYGSRARVSVKPGQEHLAIFIDDDGPGIPPEDRERVFSPFVRLESSRSQSTGGVGLGLSIARSIIRAHGGDIQLLTGSTGLRVQVTLPPAPARI